MKKVILANLLIVSSLANANEYSWILPEEYPPENNFTKDGTYYNITQEKNDLTIFLGDKNKPYVWLTKCFKSKTKGILEAACLIQNFGRSKENSNDQMAVLVKQNETVVIFMPLEAIETNYKIDSKPIITLKKEYILSKTKQHLILADLLRSKKLTYSFKKNKNSDYSSRTYNMEGLYKHLEVSKKIIERNN